LMDILDCCDRVRRATHGCGFDRFLRDDVLQSAIIHNLVIIGEATTRLSAEFRSAHRNVPWSEIVKARNVMVHTYERVSLEEVWQMATTDVPQLEALVRDLI